MDTHVNSSYFFENCESIGILILMTILAWTRILYRILVFNIRRPFALLIQNIELYNLFGIFTNKLL